MTDEEVKRLLDGVQRHFDATTDRLVAETKHHFDVSTESVNREVRLLAEAVTLLGEKWDSGVNRLDEQMDRGFAETQALIRSLRAW